MNKVLELGLRRRLRNNGALSSERGSVFLNNTIWFNGKKTKRKPVGKEKHDPPTYQACGT